MDVRSGKALVTGGAQGIGRAVCEALLSRGCKICFVDVNSERGQQTVNEFQKTYGESNCIFVKCDVSSSEAFEEAYLKAKQTFGDLNILVNNAGVSQENKAVDINLNGVIYGCNIALKYMGKNNGGDGGAVVNVGSVFGLQPPGFSPVYSAVKAGVIALTRCHGFNYEKSGVKFTCVCPSTVNTEMVQKGVTSGSKEIRICQKESRSRMQLARWKQVKDLIVFESIYARHGYEDAYKEKEGQGPRVHC
ncbi:15-hydroxyprostaglandin dehydrogenase [NAD(+)]-like [Centruroides sculpturatus]|uniref:15-hydroxyprostaglandin dehydrogenase [NAD(+)]-like n=1 Tax=Centruroides sculpturatus TaxID=218467 RepID=UPI000C6E01F7|nr:15-hydroxyprostaglandin dehydrogenase [NAD(+)]-like [Centruroides sculpturatus]